MPRRNSSTQTTKMAPMSTVTGLAEAAEIVLEADDEGAPTTGPNMVPMPPSSVISITSPDICHWTSVSEASWKTSALVPPARPARAADMMNAPQLVALDP